MTTRGLATTRRASMIEARGRFKRGNGMAFTTVRGRNLMVWLCIFTQSAEDGAIVTRHT